METLKIMQTDKLNDLKAELDFIELEDRLEMVQLATLTAEGSRCNGRCDSTSK